MQAREPNRRLYISVVTGTDGQEHHHEALESAVARRRENGEALELFESVVSHEDFMPIGHALLRITNTHSTTKCTCRVVQ